VAKEYEDTASRLLEKYQELHLSEQSETATTCYQVIQEVMRIYQGAGEDIQTLIEQLGQVSLPDPLAAPDGIRQLGDLTRRLPRGTIASRTKGIPKPEIDNGLDQGQVKMYKEMLYETAGISRNKKQVWDKLDAEIDKNIKDYLCPDDGEEMTPSAAAVGEVAEEMRAIWAGIDQELHELVAEGEALQSLLNSAGRSSTAADHEHHTAKGH